MAGNALRRVCRSRCKAGYRVRFKRVSAARQANRNWSTRRIAIATRKVEEQKAKLGMFVDQFKVETVEERISRIDRQDEAWLRGFRSATAKSWLRGRRALWLLPSDKRLTILDQWDNHCPYPATPEYFLTFLRMNGVEIPDSKGANGKKS